MESGMQREGREILDMWVDVIYVKATSDRNNVWEKKLHRMFRKHGITAVQNGFRSSFRDWVADDTDHPREVIEAVLAYMVQKRIAAGYRCTGLFERRRQPMDEWAAAVHSLNHVMPLRVVARAEPRIALLSPRACS